MWKVKPPSVRDVFLDHQQPNKSKNSFVDIPLQTAALILPLRDSVGGYRNM